MKTTVEIDDDLFKIARKRAIDEGRTFRSILHDALRAHIDMGGETRQPQEDEDRIELRRALEGFRMQVAAAEFWATVQDRSRWEAQTQEWVRESGRRAAVGQGPLLRKAAATGCIALDTDILVTAFCDEGTAANTLRALLARRAVRGTVFAVPLFCVSGFLRTVTDINRAVRVPPMRALAWMDRLVSDRAVLLIPDADYWAFFKSLLLDALAERVSIFGCQVAALCRQRGISEIWTTDPVFERFSGLKAVNPLTLGDEPETA